ncbi:MAG: flagellar biosynthesis protein FlhA [Sphingomonadales bacterium RIFCSPHIGHO2_01_FULL_65_20]|jgi:flagellar biosynthesis protein FlhA|uniref:Flagellar biosynthesis protein FlhA n=1 Tax=Sphingomonas ursincola TaxID=56361 RepID=A0A7V8RDC2_9SPHN|nr:flagellar biosynthesis protein FlhA [Sphingomonas ursincola]MBA4780074.1 flagellar biosynthesis protein FlhA [Blastomonas sp.]OHC96663.1 MAG: flagellar biosynthesis protein FlhA [Sphingomonadales bacterium RIFCSPHIGHO2_01_FULL_65_20]MBA1374309.1 flagellar biosynthesis protein FlhA [Sphingomonas ursincola]MBY0618848.1 flagellar biosynthesis protein FlhA [Sphingomonas ursincola]MCH2237699.1 flagellar biosynthesis protein FlhA [Blastomonas sp.]
MNPASGKLANILAMSRGSILPLATLLLVVFLVLPVPAMVLDIGFIFNIMISLAVLMVALNVTKPLDFSSFPTVLLFATLLRLGLNVASTRVVLVHGHEGGAAAGHVIEAFGSLLIGGDYVVGIFVFAILMIINLVVITKGAGRVSEVSARFTLDAMPGKQMAIDADLNAGLMTPEEAKARRAEVATEADFYGSMDGASKFVKGDAVAGVLILVVNIVGGIILGMASHGLGIAEAASNYTMLAIGDALVAQVPALLLSIAAASIVTRVNSAQDLPGQISGQFAIAKAWTPVAVILGIMGVLPGMPHLIILPAAAAAGFIAWKLSRPKPPVVENVAPAAPENPNAIEWEDVSDGAMLGIDVGFGLVPLVDERRDAPLMRRVTGIRKQISKELGFVIPLVRIKDDMALPANSYRITIGGTIVAEDEIWPDDLLALDSGDIDTPIEGRACKDPTFGMDAVWISADKRAEAIVAGYTVVDAATVMATHLNQMVRLNAAQLFGMDETKKLLETLKENSPQLVEGLTPQPLSLFTISAVCRELLREGVPLKDFRRICSAMVEAAAEGTTVAQIVEGVRQRIGSIIIQSLVPVNLPLPVVTLDAELETLLAQSLRVAGDAAFPIEPGLAQRILGAIEQAARPLMLEQRNYALVTSPQARKPLADLLRPRFPDTPVLSFRELPDDKPVEVVATVGGQAGYRTPQAEHSFSRG